LLTTDQ